MSFVIIDLTVLILSDRQQHNFVQNTEDETPSLNIQFLLAFSLFISSCSEERKEEKPIRAIDPVCSTTVRSNKFTWKYADKTYYFHNYSCMRAFKMNPQHFLLAKCVPDSISIDPICGMKVNNSSSYYSIYKNHAYYFDSFECRETFLLDPERFSKNKCDTTITPYSFLLNVIFLAITVD